MGLAVEVISTVYGVVGVVIFIAMSSMAVAALRSAGTQVNASAPHSHTSAHSGPDYTVSFSPPQAVVVMTAAPAEAPVE